jgi:hypothetical protein
MDGEHVQYRSPRNMQVLFLKRSRVGWKRRAAALKVDQKRLKNKVADTAKSRALWRERAKAAQKLADAFAAENESLKQQLQALKKSGPDTGGTEPPVVRNARL